MSPEKHHPSIIIRIKPSPSSSYERPIGIKTNNPADWRVETCSRQTVRSCFFELSSKPRREGICARGPARDFAPKLGLGRTRLKVVPLARREEGI